MPKAAAPQSSTLEELPAPQLRLWVRRAFAVATILTGVRYLVWRWRDTDNPSAHWFFVLFLGTELLAFSSTVGLVLGTWWQRFYRVPAVLPDRRVDLFIATFNEPLDILRDTVACAVAIRYPHRTLILDDGNRPAVATLAAEFGCVYLGRTDNVHAKAGNLNNGLRHSNAEFVVTLDADHVAVPSLIDDMLGFFRSDAVGIVQANQDCYNLDSFQHSMDWRRRVGWQMQELFFNVVQPAKDYFNATIYCGSPAMLRRSALDAIGGFATGTITEDLHTGLRMQKAGWRVLYFNRSVARGLAPQTFSGYANQWQRWGVGSTQVMRLERPILGPGLSLGQRLCYLASYEYNVVFSWVRLLSVLTVIFASLTGVFPLRTDPISYASHYLPFLVANLTAASLLACNWRAPFLMERYNFVKIHATLAAASGYFRRQTTFQVTPKSRAAAVEFAQAWPYIVLLFLVYASTVFAVIKANETKDSGELWAYLVTAMFGAYFFIVTSPGVARIFSRQELRSTYRFPQDLNTHAHFEVQQLGANGQLTAQDVQFARNLNRQGLSFTLDSRLDVGSYVTVRVALPERTVSVFGQVAWTESFDVNGTPRYANGIRFLVIDTDAGDAIMRHLFWDVAPRHGQFLAMTAQNQEAAAPVDPARIQSDAHTTRASAA